MCCPCCEGMERDARLAAVDWRSPMKPRLAVAAGLLSALPFMATAQPITGPYVGVGAGINLWHDSTSRGFRIHDEDIGFVGLGSLGWGFGNGFRVEAEGNYRESE